MNKKTEDANLAPPVFIFILLLAKHSKRIFWSNHKKIQLKN